MVEVKLKLMVAVSTIFVIVCTFFVLSTIPWEKYEIKPSQTTVPHGIEIKLYNPIVPVDVVRVFNEYTYLHVEYNGSTTKYTLIKYSVDNSSSGNMVNFNVSVSNWSLHYSIFTVNITNLYVVSMNKGTGELTSIKHYINNIIQENSCSINNDLTIAMNEPFVLHEYKDIVYFLSLMSVDGILVSTNNYTRIYSENISMSFGGSELKGFTVYVSFPYRKENNTLWEEHQYTKWTSIYGSYPVNITFSILELPNNNQWIITYMYVELENGIIHEYFLKNIEFA